MNYDGLDMSLTRLSVSFQWVMRQSGMANNKDSAYLFGFDVVCTCLWNIDDEDGKNLASERLLTGVGLH